MAYLEKLPPALAEHLAHLDCPTFADTPWVTGPPLNQRRVAVVSTAGLHRRQEPPFAGFSDEYRVIPSDTPPEDLVMSHISVNFDRSGYMQDLNLVWPLDRLRELRDEGAIGSLAEFHYSFMGATDPRPMEPGARQVARLLMADQVDAVLLIPV